MRNIGIAVVSWLVLMLGACGTRPPLNINGLWNAQLNNSDGTPAFGFTTTLTQGSGTAVNVTNFGISTPCFVSQTSETATFAKTGSSNGIVTGTFEMTISEPLGLAQDNVVILQGNRDDGTGNITGTWTLTGQSGCTGSGPFTMNQPPPV